MQTTVYGFSIMKESLEKSIYPAFAAKWKRNEGQDVSFVSNTPEKRLGVPVVVTRPKPEASAARIPVGARVAVGLTAFRVLPNFTLATERGSRAVDTRK